MDGKADLQSGFAGTGFKFDFPTMTVSHDAITDDQTKTGAGADGFCRKKGLEHSRLDLRGDAGAIVHDFDDQLIVLQRVPDTDLAVAIGAFNGFIIQIVPPLIEFPPVA